MFEHLLCYLDVEQMHLGFYYWKLLYMHIILCCQHIPSTHTLTHTHTHSPPHTHHTHAHNTHTHVHTHTFTHTDTHKSTLPLLHMRACGNNGNIYTPRVHVRSGVKQSVVICLRAVCHNSTAVLIYNEPDWSHWCDVIMQLVATCSVHANTANCANTAN